MKHVKISLRVCALEIGVECDRDILNMHIHCVLVQCALWNAYYNDDNNRVHYAL